MFHATKRGMDVLKQTKAGIYMINFVYFCVLYVTWVLQVPEISDNLRNLDIWIFLGLE